MASSARIARTAAASSTAKTAGRPVRSMQPRPVLLPWLRAQSLNVVRHAAALRPFRREEFGNGAAAPTEGHIQAVNQLMNSLPRYLLTLASNVGKAVEFAGHEPTASRLQQVVRQKHRAHDWVQAIERIWDFYFELFGQR